MRRQIRTRHISKYLWYVITHGAPGPYFHSKYVNSTGGKCNLKKKNQGITIFLLHWIKSVFSGELYKNY